MMTNWNKKVLEATDKVIAIIRKDGPKGKEYCIYSKTGKKLGCYSTRDAAEKRLAEIEIFKHMDKK